MRALQRRKIREQEGRFLAEGVRVVEDLLASPLTVRWAAVSSSLEDDERGSLLLRQIERRGVPLRRLSDPQFSRLAATDTPQGVLAVAEVPEWTMEELSAVGGAAVVLVLDAVQDPGNFGTLVRSAEALGAVGVVSLPGTVDAWNPKAIRAAAGSSFRLPIVAAGVAEGLGRLRDDGFALFGTAVGGEPVADVRTARAALVMGNEGAGLSREVSALIDATVGIPLRGRAESLNVTAAAAILLYEFLR